jgi:small subunit ribosomal protein S17
MPDGRRKVRLGEVVSDKMDKTVLVAVRWQQRHRLYKKSIRRITRFFAHDRDNECRIGDMVRIEETRPLSKMKKWRVVEIVQRREVAEVKPAELDEGLLTEEREMAAAVALGDEPVDTPEDGPDAVLVDIDDEELVDEMEEEGADDGGPDDEDSEEDGNEIRDVVEEEEGPEIEDPEEEEPQALHEEPVAEEPEQQDEAETAPEEDAAEEEGPDAGGVEDGPGAGDGGGDAVEEEERK